MTTAVSAVAAIVAGVGVVLSALVVAVGVRRVVTATAAIGAMSTAARHGTVGIGPAVGMSAAAAMGIAGGCVVVVL